MRRTLTLFMAFAAGCAFSAYGHGGADHSHDAPDLSKAAEVQPITSVAAKGAALEISVSPPALRVREPATVTLFVADWKTNRPVDGAELDVTLTGGGSSLSLSPVATEQPGVYDVMLPALDPGTYGLLVDIRSGEVSELIGISGLAVGAELAQEVHEDEALTTSRDYTPYTIAGTALVAAMAGFALGARNRVRTGTKGSDHEGQ